VCNPQLLTVATRRYSSDVPRAATKPPRITTQDLSLGELVCLALVEESPRHGWAIGTELAPDGELGRIWSLSRPLIYRALEQLTTKELVRRSGQASDQGRDRAVVSCTAAGKRVARAWLEDPVHHVRDVRTELLLKLSLLRRQGASVEPLLQAQQRVFRDHFDTLTVAGAGADPVDLWRRESTRAVRRFLDAAIDQASGVNSPEESQLMRISARNQLHARVTAVSHGEVMSSVTTELPDGQVVTAVITKTSAQDLDLAPDDEVIVVIKSTEVMLAKPD